MRSLSITLCAVLLFISPVLIAAEHEHGAVAPATEPAAQAMGGCGMCCGMGPMNRVQTSSKSSQAPQTQPSRDDITTQTPAPAPGRGMGMGMRGMGMGGDMRGGMGGGMMRDLMTSIHFLFDNHAKIHRVVEDIPGGVLTMTISDDPEVAAIIRKHVRQVKAHVEGGRPIRMWDPLFVEMLKHYRKITFEIEDVPGGVKVRDTSEDPQVALLIRQHAHRGVSEFVKAGWDRAHDPTPIPDGYKQAD